MLKVLFDKFTRNSCGKYFSFFISFLSNFYFSILFIRPIFLPIVCSQTVIYYNETVKCFFEYLFFCTSNSEFCRDISMLLFTVSHVLLLAPEFLAASLSVRLHFATSFQFHSFSLIFKFVA